MKKTITIMLALILCLTFLGCNTEKQTKSKSQKDTKNENTPAEKEYTDEELEYNVENYGGTTIIFDAIPDEDVDEDTALENCMATIRTRLDTLDYTEAVVSRNERKIKVELPGAIIEDQDEFVYTLSKPSVLEFKDTDGNVILDGGEIRDATHNYGPAGNYVSDEHHVVLEFTVKGQRLFAEATARASSPENIADGTNYIDVELDGINISHAAVKERINSNSCTISGNFTQEDAADLAVRIKSAATRCELKLSSFETTDIPEDVKDKLDIITKRAFDDVFAQMLDKDADKLTEEDYLSVKYIEVSAADEYNGKEEILFTTGSDDFLAGLDAYNAEQEMIAEQYESLYESEDYSQIPEATVEYPQELAKTASEDYIVALYNTNYIKYFKNAEVIEFSGVTVDIKAVSELKNLKNLNIVACKIKNFEELAKLDYSKIEKVTIDMSCSGYRQEMLDALKPHGDKIYFAHYYDYGNGMRLNAGEFSLSDYFESLEASE